MNILVLLLIVLLLTTELVEMAKHGYIESHVHPEAIVVQPANKIEREQRVRKVQLAGTIIDDNRTSADLTMG